jgi:hypothetical protein
VVFIGAALHLMAAVFASSVHRVLGDVAESLACSVWLRIEQRMLNYTRYGAAELVFVQN